MKFMKKVIYRYPVNFGQDYEEAEAIFHTWGQRYETAYNVGYAATYAILEDKDGKTFHVNAGRIVKFIQ